MKLGGVDFDDKLSSSRRNVVNSLFNHVITFRNAELRAAWGAIHAADAQVATARRAGRGVDAAFRDKPDVKSRLETEWDGAAKAAYAKARELAESAPARIR